MDAHPPRDRPRDRPGPHGVPADLLERAPHPRSRAVPVDRAHRRCRPQQDVRRRRPHRHLRRRGVVLRRDLARYLSAAWSSLRTRSITTVDERVGWLLLCRPCPARSSAPCSTAPSRKPGQPVLIGVMLIVFGGVLYWADNLPGARQQDEFGLRDALPMGAAQAVALQPGVSRVGRHHHDGPVAAVRPRRRGPHLVPDEPGTPVPACSRA